MEFIESFMLFSFPDDDVFLIEKDPLMGPKSGRKSCECVVLLSPKLAFIEAKSSSPKNTGPRFEEFIGEIKQKFEDSLTLYHQIKADTYGEAALQRLPINLRLTHIASDKYVIYLIIHGHREDWLMELSDALKDALRDVIRQWKMKDSNVKVLNDALALENVPQLIVKTVPKAEVDSFRFADGSVDFERLSSRLALH